MGTLQFMQIACSLNVSPCECFDMTATGAWRRGQKCHIRIMQMSSGRKQARDRVGVCVCEKERAVATHPVHVPCRCAAADASCGCVSRIAASVRCAN